MRWDSSTTSLISWKCSKPFSMNIWANLGKLKSLTKKNNFSNLSNLARKDKRGSFIMFAIFPILRAMKSMFLLPMKAIIPKVNLRLKEIPSTPINTSIGISESVSISTKSGSFDAWLKSLAKSMDWKFMSCLLQQKTLKFIRRTLLQRKK